MKIGSFDNNKPLPAATTSESKAAEARGSDVAGGEPSARVELSAAASMLSAPAQGDFDAAKVDRISRAIRDGKFEVDAEAIADKLIAHTADMIQHRPQ